DFGLADRFDARLFEPSQRAGEWHMGVQYADGGRDEPMDRRVNAERGTLDLARAAQRAAVVTDLHQAAGGHLGPMQAKRDLQVAVFGTGYREGEVIEDSLAKPLPVRQAVRRREIDTRLPRHGIWRDIILPGRDQSHTRSSSKGCQTGAGLHLST